MAEAIDPGRRLALSALSAGIAAAGWSAGAGSAAPPVERAGADGVLTDPRALYTKPPFEPQTQPFPALASKMQPPPDHGETSYRGSARLANRKALVTGGDSGIGRAAVIAYAREGADVAINYLPAEESDAQAVAKLIRDAGRKAVLLPGDVRGESFCQRLVADAAQQLGGLDILVSNAARQSSTPDIAALTTQQLEDVFRTNLFPAFWLTRAAMPHLKPGSAIIFTSSVQAYEPSEDALDYAATKAALANLCKGLAKQLAPKGIRVNAVAPGPFWTPWAGAAGPDRRGRAALRERRGCARATSTSVIG